jgi:Mg/Co/Ni transporter MgtE
MDTPEAKTTVVRVVLRRLVFGAFTGTVIAIVLFVGVAVFSATGLSFDPHGYGMFAGILFVAILTPVALALWLLYQALRRRG